MLEGLNKMSNMFEEETEKINFENVRLGVRLAGVMNAYYGAELIAYLKGEGGNGGMYMCELKPLYDEFGYKKVNNALLKLDKEIKANE